MYPGHGLVTAVRQFNQRVSALKGECETPVPKDARVALVCQIRSAHDELDATLRRTGLGELADEMQTAVWAVVGDDVEVDLGVDLAPLVRG